MSGAEGTLLASPEGGAAGAVAAPANAPPRRRLFRKYALLLVALVGGALLITSGCDFWFSYQENEAALVSVQHEKAQAAASRIEEFVDEIERQIGWTTHAQWAAGPLDQRREDYFRLLRQVPAITELSELDGEGREQLKVSRLAMDVVGSGQDFSHSPAFTEAKAHGIWFGPVYFRKQSEPYMTLAIARDGRNAGVTIAQINLKLIWDVITALKIGEGGYAYVVDRQGRLIADPDISLVLRDTDLSHLPQVAAALHPEAGAPAATVARNIAGHAVLTAHAAIGQLGWLVFVEVPLKEAFAPLYGVALRTALLLVIGLIAAALVALFLARRMTGPIRTIAAGAERIGQGELDRRIAIHTGDELEGLAGQFNRMASELQQSYAELEQRVADRTAQLSEALDQQTATAEVLGVINSSPGDLAPVFDAILERAHALCGIVQGSLELYDGERFRAVAVRGLSDTFSDMLRDGYPASDNPATQPLIAGERFTYIADLAASDYSVTRASVETDAARTLLCVPLRREGTLIGMIASARREVRPFSEKEVALLENFAAQAVIAMENARLITETREALEQQTATAEVLQVINASPGDLAPVFDAMVERAARLCEADEAALRTFDGELLHLVAVHGSEPGIIERLRQLGPTRAFGLYEPFAAGEAVVHIGDVQTTDIFRDNPVVRERLEIRGIRTWLAVALHKEGVLLGVINVHRHVVRRFTDKQIALLQNFAAQAVIAMENARLITETREALEQQTATAEVLGVINSSPGDLAPVFDAMLEKAMRLCEATLGSLTRFDGDVFHHLAVRGVPDDMLPLFQNPVVPDPGSASDALVRGEPVVHIPDVVDTDAYRAGVPSRRRLVEQTGARTAIWVALRKDDALLGSFVIYRQEVRPFSDKQIALLQNFAAQAVIAMENARLITETREALEQQTATAEVLQVINSSPGDLAPVFDAMLEKAMRLCEATYGHLVTFDGEFIHIEALTGDQRLVDHFRKIGPVRPPRQSVVERMLEGEDVIHIQDTVADAGSLVGGSLLQALVDIGGTRSLLGVALRKDRTLVGAIVVYRQEMRPFSDKQIALLQNFAAQAVIAMENARLITETRERTRDLQQSLEYQTATSDVLKVISRSPVDIGAVLDFVCDTAARLCQVQTGIVFRLDGGVYRWATGFGLEPAYREAEEKAVIAPHPGTLVGRVALAGQAVHIIDAMNDPLYEAKDELRLSNAHSLLGVPLLRDGVVIGVICLARFYVEAFTDKQIELVTTFADQAVIAIENVRLFDELRERTRDLQESLEYQTATSDVLKVMSGSAFDLAPVLETVVATAVRLCRADQATIYRLEDGEYRWDAAAGQENTPEFAEIERAARIQPGVGTLVGRVALTRDTVEIPDCWNDPLYEVKEDAQVGGIRTLLGVPLLRDGVPIGVIGLARRRVEAYSQKEIELVRTFADQAVIAIENARLLAELRERTDDLQESLEYQTAISDVLKVISQSSTDLDPVLQNVLETAMRLCGNTQGEIFRLENGVYRLAVHYGLAPSYVAVEKTVALQPGSDTLVGRVALARGPVHIIDAMADPLYQHKEVISLDGGRAMLGVPLSRDGVPIGVICIARRMPQPFSDKEIALVTTFADQAVIAIENARLFNELRERTRDLQESLEYQTATSDVLKVISRSTFDLDPILETVIEAAARLCDADLGSIFRLDGGGRYRWVVGYGLNPAYQEIEARSALAPDPSTLIGRTVLEAHTVEIADAWNDPGYALTDQAHIGNVRSMLGVPLLRDGFPIGVIGLARERVERFTRKQIELVTTFADQAVIAIENARLLGELRERTDELAHSVEELQALSEVGQAVSSTLDVRAVLSTILARSVALAGAEAGAIYRYRRAARAFRLFEAVGWDERLVGEVRRLDIAEEATGMGEATAQRQPLQIADLATRPSNPLRDATVAAGYRSALIVPLVGPDRVFGAIVLQRRAVGEFPEATVRLMQTLASQSVLAIQNARLFNEIAEKSEQLAEASRHKSQFLANMSHELRTPLNAILGYTELLADGIYGELAPRAAGVLERVQNNGKHLLALINDVLDLAKIEAGQLSLTLEDYAMPDVVHSVVSATEGLANTKGLKFTADIMPGLPTGHGDARRLSQVLLNLVGNAVKFTDKGEVAIGASAENGHFVLTVRDTGPGIAPHDHGKIFEEFQQVDSSNTRKKGGTGLGLAISKRMVEMQGGSISVASELGHGATFRVTLPIHVEAVTDEFGGEAITTPDRASAGELQGVAE